MLGIEDQDTNNELGDLDLKNYNTQEEYEEDLANEIDYIIGVVLKKSNQTFQSELIDILIKSESLLAMRR